MAELVRNVTGRAVKKIGDSAVDAATASQDTVKQADLWLQGVNVIDDDRMAEFDLSFEAHVESRYSPFRKRVGVPGGEQLNMKDWRTIFRIHGTSFEAAGRCWCFWIQLVLFFVLFAIFMQRTPSKIFTNHEGHFKTLLAFTLVFFNGKVYSQYTSRWHDICKTNGAVIAVSVNAASLLDTKRARDLMRYCISQLHIFYGLMNLNINNREWKHMLESGLLSGDEVKHLQVIGGGSAGNLCCRWCVDILRDATRDGTISDYEANFIRENVHTARGLAAKQVAYSVWPIPLPYLHAAAFMTQVLIFVTSWNTAITIKLLIDEKKPTDEVVFEFMSQVAWIAMLSAFWWSGIMMSQPMGQDTTDYDVTVELKGLWKDALVQLAAKGAQGASTTTPI